jgi:chromatin remodeling complex protein RSC6
MARISKNNTATTTPVPVLMPLDVPLQKDDAETTDVVLPKETTKKTKKSKKVTEDVSAPVLDKALELKEPPLLNVVTSETPVNNLETLVEDVVSPSVELTVTSKMADFSSQLQQLLLLTQSVRTQFRQLDKGLHKELKAYYKASSKKNKRSGNRQPSGFVRPTLISDELALFLGKEIGTKMARTEVSKEINQYIRTNNLQDKANGRNINPDAKLSVLLKLNKGDLLSYFNLQKYMKHHFVKVPPAPLTNVVV